MGITVVSGPALNAASTAPAATAATTDGGAGTPGGFAALLVQQLTGGVPGTAIQATGQPEKGASAKDGGEQESDAAAGADSLGIPFLATALDVRPAAAAATTSVASQESEGLAAVTTQQQNSWLDQSLATAAPLAEELGGAGNAADSAKFAAPAPAAETQGAFAALINQATQKAAPAATPETVPSPSTPVAHADWGKDVGDSVVWMTRQNVQTAEISLNPPHLGPLQISLNVNGDQATAVFASPHAEVRQAITDAMPQLREMLAGAGINLGQANVGAQLQQQANQNAQQPFNGGRSGSDNAILPDTSAPGTATAPSLVRRGHGLVDLFA